MKLQKISKEVTLTKNKAAFELYANESIRILPKTTMAIPTGVIIQDITASEFVHVDLNEYILINRPFILVKNVYHLLDKDCELELFIHNTGSRAAIIDRGEKLAVCVVLNTGTTGVEK